MRRIVLFILMLGAFLVMQTENVGLSPPEITCEQSYYIDVTEPVLEITLVSCYALVTLQYDLRLCELDLMTQDSKEIKPILAIINQKQERVAVGLITRLNFISSV